MSLRQNMAVGIRGYKTQGTFFHTGVKTDMNTIWEPEGDVTATRRKSNRRACLECDLGKRRVKFLGFQSPELAVPIGIGRITQTYLSKILH